MGLTLSAPKRSKAVEDMYASEEIPDFMKKFSIKWTFQPLRPPHLGGAHKSLVFPPKNIQHSRTRKEQFPSSDGEFASHIIVWISRVTKYSAADTPVLIR